jgi:hypothetical protein
VLVVGEDVAYLKTECAARELEGPAKELQHLSYAPRSPG